MTPRDPAREAATPSLAGRIAALRPRIRRGESPSDPGQPTPPPPPARIARGWLVAAAMLLAAPLVTALGATLLAQRAEGQAALLARRIAARPAPATREAVAAALGGETISATIARVGAALPDGATLHALGRGTEGALEMEIDAADPEAVRAALARDPALAGLATAGETMIPDRGLRMRLVEKRR